VKRIAAMAEAYDVALAPHCPLGPIALAACVQVDGAVGNALIQEQSLDIHYNEGTDELASLADPSVFEYDDGYVSLPEGPGLGVEIDEEVVRERAGDVDWHSPVWRHDDGSVAEW
jgi:galactonate dehydratase